MDHIFRIYSFDYDVLSLFLVEILITTIQSSDSSAMSVPVRFIHGTEPMDCCIAMLTTVVVSSCCQLSQYNIQHTEVDHQT
jgi:hypothetical protein